MFPEVVQVKPNNDYTVNVCFCDGKIVCYDVKNKLEKNRFKQLKDIDIAPNTLYALPAIDEKSA